GHPATIVERRPTPGRVIDPSPTVVRIVYPAAGTVRRPARRHGVRHPDRAVSRLIVPRAVLVEILGAGDTLGQMLRALTGGRLRHLMAAAVVPAVPRIGVRGRGHLARGRWITRERNLAARLDGDGVTLGRRRRRGSAAAHGETRALGTDVDAVHPRGVDGERRGRRVDLDAPPVVQVVEVEGHVPAAYPELEEIALDGI